MLLAEVKVKLYMNGRDIHFLPVAVCGDVDDIVGLAAWEAVENDLQERLDTAFPNQFTIKVEVD